MHELAICQALMEQVETIARQAVRFFLGQHFIVQLPRCLRFFLGHFLDGITHVHDHEIIDSEIFTLHHEQADIALHTFSFAGRVKTIYVFYLHRYAEAHAF